MYLDPLQPKVVEQLDKIRSADIVVGIPSFNNASTIGQVVKAISLGLAKYFGEYKPVIVNSDGGSKDGTSQAFLSVSMYEDMELNFINSPFVPAQRIALTYQGVPGKGSALKAIFSVADYLNAEAVLVVDSDLRSITPEWVERLLSPVLFNDCDYVVPYYVRHKFDATITNAIAYPLTRALYGVDVRQPIGGDFGLSILLARNYLTKDVWNTDIAKYGIDIWMTTVALAEGFEVVEAFLGAKIHDAKDPVIHLGPMFTQVVGTIFSLMKEYQEEWQEIKETLYHPPMYGYQSVVYPEPMNVEASAGWAKFLSEGKKFLNDYAKILSPPNFKAIKELLEAGAKEISFPPSLWVKVVYDYAVYGKNKESKFLNTLIPLYLGYTAAFIDKVKEFSPTQVEEFVQKVAEEFWQAREYLIKRWNE